MKRTTLSLPDDLSSALQREAQRRRVSMSQIAREALEARLGHSRSEGRRLPFAALGRSGYHTTARDMDDILEKEWSLDRNR